MQDNSNRNTIIFVVSAVIILIVYQMFVLEPSTKRRNAELARQNEIRLDPRRVSEALSTIASTYEEPEKVVELYSRDPQLMSGLQNRVIEDQVVEWIADHARCNVQKLSFNEVMRPGA